MSETVEMPTIASGEDLTTVLTAMATRIENIAQVLRSEHVWLKKRVDRSREVEDADIPFKIANNLIDQEEADDLMTEDHLILKRQQVDNHLRNLDLGDQYLTDIAGYITTMLAGREGRE